MKNVFRDEDGCTPLLCAGRFLTLAAVILAGGCVNQETRLPAQIRSKLTQVRIVALESQPLELVTPQGSPDPLLFGSSGGAVFLLLSLLSLGNQPEADQNITLGDAKLSQLLHKTLGPESDWRPTTILAKEVAIQLEAREITATVSPDLKPIPRRDDRSPTWLGANRRSPMQDWYFATGLAPDHPCTVPDQTTYVLEVGVLNYGFVEGRVFAAAAIKVIDPSSGAVVARACDLEYSELDLHTLEKALANDGILFKQAFSERRHLLVGRCLRSLGLVP